MISGFIEGLPFFSRVFSPPRNADSMPIIREEVVDDSALNQRLMVRSSQVGIPWIFRTIVDYPGARNRVDRSSSIIDLTETAASHSGTVFLPSVAFMTFARLESIGQLNAQRKESGLECIFLSSTVLSFPLHYAGPSDMFPLVAIVLEHIEIRIFVI